MHTSDFIQCYLVTCIHHYYHTHCRDPGNKSELDSLMRWKLGFRPSRVLLCAPGILEQKRFKYLVIHNKDLENSSNKKCSLTCWRCLPTFCQNNQNEHYRNETPSSFCKVTEQNRGRKAKNFLAFLPL